jgi:protein involved in polysaccharide export with SLBB domain
MSILFNQCKRVMGLAGMLCAAMVLLGCSSLSYVDPNPDKPYVFPGQPSATNAVGASAVSPTASGSTNPAVVSLNTVLRPSELLLISYSDLPITVELKPQILRIGEDGVLSGLHLNMQLVAAGKTVEQLQEEIRKKYVPDLYRRLSVQVKPEERYYYVGGEVRYGNKIPYTGQVTVLRAIEAAQGFGEFANRTKIQLRRANGQSFIINWKKARYNPKLDLEVFPYDHVIVPRRGI